MLLSGRILWCSVVFGDCCFEVRPAFAGIWHCLRILALFIFWKLRCKVVFDHKISSLYSFCSIGKDEVRHRVLAKGSLPIKDVQYLDLAAYSDFISALVSLRKRL